MEEQQKFLNSIRRHIELGEMSFIVGSGFSKNVSDLFPNWEELLSNAVLELYSIKKNNTTSKKIHDAIYSHGGYLEVAEEYVRRNNGFHEAIDLYIEKNTPYLEKNKDDFTLCINGKKKEVKVDVSCHKLLRDLNVKNIYTFNYDNCLEAIFDASEISNSKQIREDLKKKLDQFEESAKQYTDLIESLRHEKDVCDTDISISASTLEEKMKIYQKIVNYLNENYDIKLERSFAPENVEFNKKVIANKRKSLNDLLERNKYVGDYIVVTRCTDISLTEQTNAIYKLHGSIRKGLKDRGIEFDYDKHIQYVITSSDYREYAQKHEAFVNLMKISLLKGYFCIIGFSCDDPNFKVWIEWVKDILDKRIDDNGNNEDEDKKKIFYINVGDSELDEHKCLILKNHYITVINLYEIFKEAKSPKDKVYCFLSSLNEKVEDIDILISKVSEKMMTADHLNSSDYKIEVERVFMLMENFRLLSIRRRYNEFSIYRVLKWYIDKKPRGEVYSKFLYVLLRRLQMPLNKEYIDLAYSYIRRIKISEEIKDKLCSLIVYTYAITDKCQDYLKDERNEIISYIDDSELKFKYETIMHELYDFSFDSAYKHTVGWEPEGHDGFNRVRKYVLKSLLEKNNNRKRNPFDLLNFEDFDSSQDFIYAYDILKLFFPNEKNEQYIQKTRIIKNLMSGKRDLRDLNKTKKLYLDLLEEKDDVRDYGTILYNYGNTDNTDYAKLYINMMIRLSLLTSVANIKYIKEADWYEVCKSIYKEYPKLCLFYTLLYSDEKIVKRVVEDYIYNINDNKILENLFISMLEAYKQEHTPQNIKKNILRCSYLFMFTVPSERWGDLFCEIYNDTELKFTEEREWNIFINNGIRYIENYVFKKNVINSILSKKEQLTHDDNSLLISAMANIGKEIKKDPELQRCIISYIRKEHKSIAEYYIVLNVGMLIEGRGNVLTESLLKFDKAEISRDPQILEGCAYIYHQNPDCQRLREIILDGIRNTNLCWNNGIVNGGVRFYFFETKQLNINKIQNHVSFDDKIVNDLYTKLKGSLKDIIEYKRNYGTVTFLDFERYNLALDMLRFILKNKEYLEAKNDFSSTKSDIENYVRYDSLVIMLSSDDDKTLDRGLDLLNVVLACDEDNDYSAEVDVVLSRIITRKDILLEKCIKAAASALDKTPPLNKDIFSSKYKTILKLYSRFYDTKDSEVSWPIDARKEYMEKYLIHINESLKSHWKVSEEFWDKHIPLYK